MSIALMVRIEALERKVAALEAALARARSEPGVETAVPATPTKKKAR